ncbi:MAG: hypothetical protein AMS27_01795 [Bacteroides sp. SM23_62_1]|nr:MAG: hypothetical protein AMS27_01795 [Bacteroides sp. SM23_62_1]
MCQWISSKLKRFIKISSRGTIVYNQVTPLALICLTAIIIGLIILLFYIVMIPNNHGKFLFNLISFNTIFNFIYVKTKKRR